MQEQLVEEERVARLEDRSADGRPLRRLLDHGRRHGPRKDRALRAGLHDGIESARKQVEPGRIAAAV